MTQASPVNREHRRDAQRLSAGVRLVLVRPRNAENLGAVARAMKNFGLRDWVVVGPNPLLVEGAAGAQRLAVGAGELLDKVRLAESLPEAVADCAWVVGTTMRTLPGRQRLAPRELAAHALERLEGGRVALVFGDERSGLTNDDLSHCHDASAIPTAPEQPSLNLAQAVLLYCYELRQAALAQQGRPRPPAPRSAEGRDLQEVERRLRAVLTANGFLGQVERHAVKDLMQSLRRAQLTRAEAHLWVAALKGRT